jgi:hypothetical protein
MRINKFNTAEDAESQFEILFKPDNIFGIDGNDSDFVPLNQGGIP